MLSLPPIECGIRHALEAWKNHVSKFVTASTITVAVGVALEGVEFVQDACAYIARKRFQREELAHLEELAKWLPVGKLARSRFHHPAWLEKLERWAKRFGRLGLILVVVGVVGEWRYGTKLEDAHNALHVLDVAELTAAQVEAGDAAKSAESAHAEAAETKQETTTLKINLAQARARLENLKQDTAKAESDLQKSAENLAKTALSRRISNPEKFIAALKGETQAKILLLYAPNDAESFDFAFNIWTLLGRPYGAGWDVSAPTPVPQDWPTPIGWPQLETAPPAIKCGASNGRAVGMRSGVGFEIAITDMMALRTLVKAFWDDGFSTSTHAGQPLARPGQPGISDPHEIVLCVGQR
jgi:hypothetical protein